MNISKTILYLTKTKSANKILKFLETKVRKTKPQALAISVQAGAGNYTQSRILLDSIRTISLQNTYTPNTSKTKTKLAYQFIHLLKILQ